MNKLITRRLLALVSVGCLGATLVAQEVEKKSKWERRAGAGLTLTQGNNDTVLFTADVAASRKWDKDELTLGADGQYGEVEGTTNAQRARAFAQYNRLISERTYVFARAEGVHDTIADVDYRITLSPGFGHYFLKDERKSLSVEVGPSAVIEKVGGISHTYGALRVGEKFEYKISDRARLWQTAEYLPQVDRFSNYIINAEIGLETDITENFKLRTFIQDIYDNEPAAGRKRNDVKLVSSVAYTF